jgi:hypothetical protein
VSDGGHLASKQRVPQSSTCFCRRLRDRLGEWAKFDKQRALALLQRRLLSLDLKSTQYDFQHRLLAFLYSASCGALNSEYDASDLVERLAREAQSAGKCFPVCGQRSDVTRVHFRPATWESSPHCPLPT